MKRRMSFISEEELPDAGPEGVVEDEGYSEDPLSRINRSQPRAGSVFSMRRPSTLEPEALINSSKKLDVDDRRNIILHLLRSMPAAMVQDIVNAMYPILHISFLERLPPEVCLKILGLLDPYDLISLAQCSKQASSLSYDRTLWQNLYYREGFLANQKELRKFEQELKESNERERATRQQQLRSRPSTSGSTHAPPKKRSRPTPGDYEVGEVETIEVDPGHVKKASLFNNASSVSSTVSSSSTIRYDVDGSGDQTVLSPSAMSPLSPASFQRHESTGSSNGGDLELPPLTSSLTTIDRLTNARKLNWQFLYTQRRRLEQNWANDRYTNYQIPHPDYPEEAHTDAIYSIQQDGTYVVTASRDNTVRIWDLSTQRLLRILRGHKRSVLCVQFDASPDQDVVMSGSSDGAVRIYKFSTGVCTNIIAKAHDESVLNLKFNKHILVTCSKDKTLKIFNRKELFPGDLGYRIPADFVYNPVPQTVNYPGMIPNPYGDLPVKEPYSVIGYLEGHGAAVNYCVIRGNEVVSASGDRLAKVWDWPTGVCTRSLVGHTKGVACVVYDGRRIVTGSSDCEIKVFDRQTGVEVAALKGPGGHTGLVRTVQAGFADAGNEAELREEDRRRAWMVDRNFFSSLSERPDYERAKWAMDQRSRSAGNAGSERPEDIICYGATLPPGGGGSRYGRIISGSYDENVIVWRKDGSGVWKPKSVLKPADAMRAALLQHELSLPDPGRLPDLLQPILDSLGQPTDTSAWRRAFIEALLDAGPDVLRAGLAAYPMLMHHAPRLIAMIRVNGGTVDSGSGDGTRRLIPGGMVIKGRLRAIVHAAMWREMRALTGKLVRWGGEEKLFKKWVGDASRSINLAERALEGVLEGHEEPLGDRDTVWKQRMIHYQMQASKRPTLSSTSHGTSHGAGIIQPSQPSQPSSAHRRITNSNFPSGPSPDPTEQTLEQQISTYLQTETSYLSQWRRHLKDLEDLKDATRNHHVVLSRMLHEVEPRGRRVTGTLGLGGVDSLNPQGNPILNNAAAGGGNGGGAPINGAAPPGGGGQGGGNGGVGGDEAETSWEGKVYNLRFDARRIVCASSNPIILIWDFACGDREIDCASRFFKGVGCEE